MILIHGEPHHPLGGKLIHEAVIDLYAHLLRTGHEVTLDEDGAAVVWPLNDLGDTTLYLINKFREDLALLVDCGGRTIH